jgi:hypothetical protein
MKTIHFNCPTCERPVEAPATMSGRLIHCPSCEESLRPPRPAPKTSPSWLIIVCIALLGFFCVVGIPTAVWLTSKPKRESPNQLRARLLTEAQATLAEECTNAVVGLNRIIHRNLFVNDPDPNKWSADITAEYVNHIGGIDRTNLPFAFWAYDSPVDKLRHLLCRVDNLKIAQTERDALKQKLTSAASGGKPSAQ